VSIKEKTMKRIQLIILLFCLLGCNKYEYDILGTTEKFTIESSVINDEFTIFVYLPPDYDGTNNEYPLIIGLDGDNEFETMSGIVSNEINQGNIPDVIFVGIGYGSEKLNDEKRNRDYTPTITEDYDISGGAADFYEFIQVELIPQLEDTYAINPFNTKTLMGHSFGGLFTLFALFQERENNPFNKFIPVASSFWYDSGVLFEFEENYAQAHDDLAVKVYTTMGSLEGGVMIASFAEMNERLENREFQNLDLYSELLEKFGHSRSDYATYEKALSYVFN